MNRLKAKFSNLDAVYRNIIVQSGGTIAAQLIPVAVSPVLSRLYTPDEFGIYGIVFFVSALLAIVFSLRVDHGVIVAPSDADALTVVQASLAITSCAAVAFALGAALVVLTLPGEFDPVMLITWALLCPLAGFTLAVMRTTTLWQNRTRNFRLVSRSRISRAISTALASIGGWFSSYGLVYGLVVGNAVGIWMLARGIALRPFLSLAAIAAVVRENSKFVMFSLPADLVNTTASRIPLLIFPPLFGLEQTGYLSLTYLVIATPARFIGTAIGEVFYSHAAREYEQTGSCRGSVKKIGALLAGLSVVGFGLLFLIAEPLFHHAFGPTWQPAATFTQIMVPMLIVNFVASPLSVVFYIAGRQKEDFFWQLGLLMTSTAACGVGYWLYGTPSGSLIFLSLSGAVMYAIYLAMIIRFSKRRPATVAGC